MSFNKDALLHKLQEKIEELEKADSKTQERIEEETIKEVVREALYGFIDHYKSDDFERVDLKIIADNYIENDCGKEEK